MVRDPWTVISRTGKPVAKRDWSILVMLVCLAASGGCAVLPEPVRNTSWLRRHNPFASDMAGETVQLDVTLVGRPIADPFVNEELWQHTDAMTVSLERKAAVEDNGFRVGQIVGMTPGKLQDLLTSERYCSNSRRHLIPSGNCVSLKLSPILARSDFVVQQGKQSLPVALDQACFCLDVKATLTGDGKTRLAFIPKVENGAAALPFEPDPEQQSWKIRTDKPCQAYPEAGWEVVLAPGEYLVIGAVLSKDKSLGHRSFVQEDEKPVQRLLALRTGRPANGAGTPTLEDMARAQSSPCLALQASMSASR
jgi:hypothetical protein